MHGLGGDAIQTWTHPKSNAFWLEEFLPYKVKDARVLTFGYDASGAFGRATADVIDHAKSLLSSLLDKRDEEDVGRGISVEVQRAILLMSAIGEGEANHIHSALARWYCGKAGERNRQA